VVTFRRHLPTSLYIAALILGGLALYCLGLSAAGKAPVAYWASYATGCALCVVGGLVSARYRPAADDTENTSLIGQMANNYARAGDVAGLEIVKSLAAHDRGAKQ